MSGGKMGNDGFTLIEVMIGLTIFAVGLLGLAGMQMTGITGNSRAHVITAEVAASTGVVSQILALSGDDPLTDGGGNSFGDFLTTDDATYTYVLADSEIDGAGDCTVVLNVDVDPVVPDSDGDDVTYAGLTLINVAVTNSAGKSVTQQIMKRRY